ncbi:SDR family NAD(P)-dependent oxidoreductase [Kitasatospora sp. NPDC008115]|uniref:type I polyketide synthase n=1 Tax=Kitasatospora sp. NPDC008115 TaxID=3364022 RepID=UPI0036DFC722
MTGGTGALGGHVARWVAARGAEHVVLTSRRGGSAPGVAELEAELAASGVRVTVAACDVADREELRALLDSLPEELPLTTVIHLAGATRLAPVTGTDAAHYAETFGAKVAGAANLDALVDGYGVENVVFFSSIAGVWGSGDHAAYAAGNAYLDVLAEQRRQRGVPATTVAWGVWGGATADDEASVPEGVDVDRLRRQGLPLIAPARAFEALQQALVDEETFIAVADVDWDRFIPVFSSSRPTPLFDELPEAGRPGTAEPVGAGEGSAQAPIAERLAGTSAAERDRVLLELVRSEVAAVLGHSGTEDVQPGRSFKELGFDSLTAVELRNRLTGATGTRLPATLVFDHPSPKAVVAVLRGELFPGGSASAAETLLEELDRFEEGLAALAQDGDEARERILGRLRSILGQAGVAASPQHAPGQVVTLESASDEEMFNLIGREFGIS